MLTRRIAMALVALALGLGVAACGDDEDDVDVTTMQETTATDTTTDETTTTEETTAVGRELFVANCGTCHTLSDAGTSGNIGPSLDGVGLDVDAIEAQVAEGGDGMPAFADTLSDDEIDDVAEYVAAAS